MIAFSGIDCAGKSTQIAAVEAAFAARGKRTHLVWSRIGFTGGMMLLKRILRQGDYNVGHDHAAQHTADEAPPAQTELERVRKFSRKERIYMCLSIWDMLRLYAVDLRVAELFGRQVICDRYLWDSCVDYRLHYPGVDFERWFSWRLLVRLAARPTHGFMLVIPAEEAERRIIAKHELHPDTPERRAARMAEYMQLIDEGRWSHVIDGARPREAITADILAALSL